MIATDAIIGAFAAASMPGTAYACSHVMVRPTATRASGAHARRHGGISQALAKAAKDMGVDMSH